MIEGLWEDIAQRAGEFAGRQVRLIVLDTSPPVPLDRALEKLLSKADRLAAVLPPSPVPHRPDAWADSIAEKYRRQGFEL